ncbi:MAG: hypothetical protein ACMUEM_05515 [Flavobacteriales bacterium AspAUS03]
MNNARISIDLPLEFTTLFEWYKVLDFNLNGIYLVLHEVGKVDDYPKELHHHINTSSISGLIVNVPQAQASHNTSKVAVIILIKVQW